MSPRLDANGRLVRSRKRKAGFTSVMAVVILLGLVVVMGSVALIWGNNFNFEKQKVSDYYTTNMNKIKERLIIEDLWLSKKPAGVTSTAEANMGVVVIRNAGDIAITIKEVKINVLDINGAPVCTTTCEPGTSFQNTVRSPFNPDSSTGLISSKQTLMVTVDNLDWDHVNSESLEVFIETERGSIIWRVYDWEGNVAAVPTCNGHPVTIFDIDNPDNNNDLVGTSGDDVIHGFGNPGGTFDVIQGMGGNDIICGGEGNDTILGGPLGQPDGDDKIYGENGNDNISGMDGNDTIYGGNGDDTLNGNDGNDIIDGGLGTDVCTGETVSNCP